jgi:hypothetical protein
VLERSIIRRRASHDPPVCAQMLRETDPRLLFHTTSRASNAAMYRRHLSWEHCENSSKASHEIGISQTCRFEVWMIPPWVPSVEDALDDIRVFLGLQ